MSIPRKFIRPDGGAFPGSPDFELERRRSRAEVVRQEVRLRLGGVCQHLSPDVFDALVLQIARVQLKGEGN
jgi:hypothetical protein